jgi:hypothetical protein
MEDIDLIDYFDAEPELSGVTKSKAGCHDLTSSVGTDTVLAVDTRTHSTLTGEVLQVAPVDLDEVFSEVTSLCPTYIPTASTIRSKGTTPEKSKSSQDSEPRRLDLTPQTQHDRLLRNEFQFLSVQMRASSKYELLRAQEECYRFHAQSQEREETEGAALAAMLLEEIDEDIARINTEKSEKNPTSRRGSLHYLKTIFGEGSPSSNITKNRAVRAFFVVFENEYARARQSVTQNSLADYYFPWRNYDAGVAATCAKLLEISDISSCSVYMSGYIESVCRIPEAAMSPQGQQCALVAGTALGRHPFGSFFSKFIFGIKSVLQQVQLTLSSISALDANQKVYTAVMLHALLTTRIGEFVALMSNWWAHAWCPEATCFKTEDFVALTKECVNRIVIRCLHELPEIQAFIAECRPGTSQQIMEGHGNIPVSPKRNMLLTNSPQKVNNASSDTQENGLSRLAVELSGLLAMFQADSTRDNAAGTSGLSTLKSRAFEGRLSNRYLRALYWRLLLKILPADRGCSRLWKPMLSDS